VNQRVMAHFVYQSETKSASLPKDLCKHDSISSSPGLPNKRVWVLRRLDVQDNTAFAAYYMMVKATIPGSVSFESKLRFTLGLVKENNQWHIIQSHFSAPIAAQKVGESFPRA